LDENVVRLDIAVKDAVLMGKAQRVADLDRDI
jgi:hypothetical protein